MNDIGWFNGLESDHCGSRSVLITGSTQDSRFNSAFLSTRSPHRGSSLKDTNSARSYFPRAAIHGLGSRPGSHCGASNHTAALGPDIVTRCRFFRWCIKPNREISCLRFILLRAMLRSLCRSATALRVDLAALAKILRSALRPSR